MKISLAAPQTRANLSPLNLCLMMATTALVLLVLAGA